VSKPHWVELEEEIRDVMGLNAKLTKGSGNQKGDCDVKMRYNDINILFEAKSEEIPKGNLRVLQNEWDKMQNQVKAFYGVGIYVRRNKKGEVVACLKIEDLKRIMNENIPHLH